MIKIHIHLYIVLIWFNNDNTLVYINCSHVFLSNSRKSFCCSLSISILCFFSASSTSHLFLCNSFSNSCFFFWSSSSFFFRRSSLSCKADFCWWRFSNALRAERQLLCLGVEEFSIYSSWHTKVPIPFLSNGFTVCVAFPLRLRGGSIVNKLRLRLRWVTVSLAIGFVFVSCLLLRLCRAFFCFASVLSKVHSICI